MANARGSPAKKRRIDSGVVSSEAIAQANSTLQFFTGQRHNRWMHGFVPPPPPPSTSGANARTVPAVVAPKDQAVNAGSVVHNRRVSSSVLGNGSERGSSGVVVGNRGVTAGNPSATPGNQGATAGNQGAHVGDAASNNRLAPTNPNNAAPPTGGTQVPSATDTNTTMRPPAQPGLPSPAASDEITVSPVIGGGVPQPKHRARPPISHTNKQHLRALSTDHAHPPPPPAAHSTPPTSASPQQQSQPRRTPSLSNVSHANASASASVNANASPPLPRPAPFTLTTGMPGLRVPSRPNTSSPLVPSQPNQSSPQVPFQPTLRLQPYQQAQDPWLSPASMSQRFQDFCAQHPSHTLNGVEGGRLTLLADALAQSDLFFIALSQVHALTATPHLIPHSAQGLDKSSFHYLDFLICSTTPLSPPVLTFLQNFPAPIVKLYFSVQTAGLYEPVVQQVVDFLHRLPQHWDRLTEESKKRKTPPLAEDLYDTLHLPSPVFHLTAFRAIARLIFDPAHFDFPEEGIDRLEVVFKMDQMFFVQYGRRRGGPKPKDVAYRAFRSTREAWRRHEIKLKESRRGNPLLRLGEEEKGFVFPAADLLRAYPQQGFLAGLEPSWGGGGGGGGKASAALLRPGSVRGPQLPSSAAGQVSSNVPRGPHLPLSTGAQVPSSVPQRSGVSQSAPGTVMLQQNTAPQQNIAMPQQKGPHGRFLFPNEFEPPRPQPTHPDPIRSALHQAHLRSPTLTPATPTNNNNNNNTTTPENLLYRYVAGFPLSPKKLRKDVPVQTHTFHIAPENFNRIPAITPGKLPGERPSRNLDESSRTYRLRCAPFPPTGGGFPTEARWVEAENVWPEELYLDINGCILEPRRKLLHGRYLPIDLTGFVKAGENVITATVNRARADGRRFDFVIAVEMVGVMSGAGLKRQVGMISAEESREAIRRSLAGGVGSTTNNTTNGSAPAAAAAAADGVSSDNVDNVDDDDDILVTSSTLTIHLLDPHTYSRIFTTPVRGASCKHKDCFDLDTFLAHCRRDGPGWPTSVDCWRCPLCRGDVRPHTLVVDGFLVEVRRSLEERGLLERGVRAIVVGKEGAWEVKGEERRGVRSESLEGEEREGEGERVVEVVEID